MPAGLEVGGLRGGAGRGTAAPGLVGPHRDDLYIAYTGGTTGMPKGVVWRHEDLFFAALGGGDPDARQGPDHRPDELPGRSASPRMVQLCAPPLMHVSAHWGAFNSFFGGGTVVLLPRALRRRRGLGPRRPKGVNSLTVVGDAMARPLLDDLDPADTSPLFVFASGGALLSPGTKAASPSSSRT